MNQDVIKKRKGNGGRSFFSRTRIFSYSPSSKSINLRKRKGSGLIVVILVLAFMLAVGVTVLVVSSTGPKVSSAMRFQQEAFNAAEAGFNAARVALEEFFVSRQWSSFSGHYLTGVTDYGIDIPFINNDLSKPNPGYFRRLTDEQILSLLDPNHDGVADVAADQLIFFEEPLVRQQGGSQDYRCTYTVFLIDDEAGSGGPSDPKDVLMVCIGVVRSGPNITDRILATCRLEIELEAPD